MGVIQWVQNAEVTQMGIHWNGEVGPSTGTFYFGDAARANPYYDPATAQKIFLDTTAWYSVRVTKIVAMGKAFSADEGYMECNAMQGKPCIMDTGTPVLLIPQAVHQAAYGTPHVTGRETGSLEFELQGFDGQPVTLQFDVGALVQNNWLESHKGKEVIL